jgi:hypothetical protein
MQATLGTTRHLLARLGALTSMCALSIALTPLTAGASPTWSLQALASPTSVGATSASIAPISCPTSTLCFAAESHLISGGGGASILKWQGSAWSAVALPTVTTKAVTAIYALTCPSSTSCTALGAYGSPSYPDGLAAISWDGTSWTATAITTPNLGGGGNRTAGLSCLDASDCVAATTIAPSGGGELGYTLVTMTEASGTWSTSTRNLTSAFSSAAITSLYCASLTSCVAVGQGSGASPTLTEAATATLSGSTWSYSLTTIGVNRSTLRSLWCSSVTQCWAVGSVGAGNLTHGLEAGLSGTTWTLGSIAFANTTTTNELDSIICHDVSHCEAVGSAVNAIGGATRLAYGAYFGSWSMSLPSYPNLSATSANVIDAVACPTSTTCLFAGGQSPTLAGVATPNSASEFAYTAVSGTITTAAVPAISPVPSARLTAVSCATTTHCVAIGVGQRISGLLAPVVETWNGSSWTSSTITMPKSTAGQFLSISCPSATSCAAVGLAVKWTVTSPSTSTTTDVPLIATLSGTKWTVTVPKSPITQASELTDVACPKLGSCIAVGSGLILGGSFHFVLSAGKWTGGKFTSPTGVKNPISPSISCLSASYCVAVATPNFSTRSAVWTRHGTVWAVSMTPSVAGSPRLNSISCWATSQCNAVGVLGAKAELARLNGTKWTFTSVAGPASSQISMSDVTCASATNCTAIGAVTGPLPSPGDVAATFTISGSSVTYSLPAPVTVPGGSPNVQTLSSVACPKGGTCRAVGALQVFGPNGVTTLQPIVAHP